MKLFYVTGKRDNGENVFTNVALVEELDSDYDSKSIEVDLFFDSKIDLSFHKTKIALFTAEEIEVLMSIKNKTIPWGSKQTLKGMNVGHFDRLFGWVEEVEVKEVTLDIF